METDVGQVAMASFQWEIAFFRQTESNTQLVGTRMGKTVKTTLATFSAFRTVYGKAIIIALAQCCVFYAPRGW